MTNKIPEESNESSFNYNPMRGSVKIADFNESNQNEQNPDERETDFRPTIITKNRYNSKIEDTNNQNLIEYKYKIILIGDYGVGKSSILERFVNNVFPYDVKIKRPSFLTKSWNVNMDTKLTLDIYDSVGEEKFSSLSNQFYKDTYGVAIIYDITQRETFDNLDKWEKESKEHSPNDVEIMVIGNKADLSADRKVSAKEGFDIAKKYNGLFIETSAKSGNNIELAFEELGNKIINSQSENKRDERKTIFIDKKKRRKSKDIFKENEKKKCCN